MANGINDILSVYRQSISSERQTRLAEMQMSLQSLQAQSERRFQEEGRQRENALFSLKHAEERTKEAIGKDAGTMVAALSGLMETNDDQELYDFKDQDTLKASGLSQEDQMTAYTIVSMYSSDSESLQKLGRQAAVSFARRFSNEYKVWAASGYSEETKRIKGEKHPVYKGSLIAGMENSGLVYLGEDEVRRKLSVEPYLMVSSATDAIDRIYEEYDEIGAGDYKIQRNLSYDANVKEIDISSLADDLLGGGDEGGGKGDEIDAKDDLESFKQVKLAEHLDIKDKMTESSDELIDLKQQKDNIEFYQGIGEMNKKEGDSLIVELNTQIQRNKKAYAALLNMEGEVYDTRKKIWKEEDKRMAKKYPKGVSAPRFLMGGR